MKPNRSDAPSAVSAATLVAQLQELGVRRGGVLVVHASYRAVRPVEGGPQGLIEALVTALGPAGTLVMPTMTDGETVFDPARTPTDGMGVTAETFWRLPGVLRSGHPSGSFAAVGPHAAEICRPQPLSPPHGPDSPVGRVHDLAGQVLLLGVHHSENTTVHLAEALAEVPYSVSHPTVVGLDVGGRPVTELIPETDHCCMGFRQVDAWLQQAGRQSTGPVGNAAARLCDSSAVVEVVTDALARDPLLLLCRPDSGCEECDRAHASTVAAGLPSRLPSG